MSNNEEHFARKTVSVEFIRHILDIHINVTFRHLLYS